MENIKTIEITGYDSGDYECGCFAVSKEEYKRLTGREPQRHDLSPFIPNYYMIYPDIIYPEFDKQVEQKFKFTVEVLPL